LKWLNGENELQAYYKRSASIKGVLSMDNNKIVDYVFFALKEFNIDEDAIEETLNEMKELLDNNELTAEEVAQERASWE
jgi:arsenate reductase-like glutaredoxin family protein